MSEPGSSQSRGQGAKGFVRRFGATLAVAFVGCVASDLLYFALEREESSHVELALRAEESKVREKLESHLQIRLLSLRRMAARFEVRRPQYEEWQFDVDLLSRDTPGYQALGWVDPQGFLRWVHPIGGNETALNVDYTLERQRREAMQRSRETRTAVVTRTVPLLIGGKPGFIALFPLFDRKTDAFQGHLIGVFRVQDTLDTLLGPDIARLSLRVFDGDQEIYHSHVSELAGASAEGRTRVKMKGLDWDLRIRLLPSRMEELRSTLPLAAFSSGIAMTALACAAVFLAQSARARSKKLRSTTELQRALLDGSDYAIIFAGPDGTIRDFNAGAQKMLGYSAEELVGTANLTLLHRPLELEQRAAELTPKLGRPVLPNADALTAITLQEGSEESEWTYRRKDGSAFPVQLSMAAIKESGELSGFLAIAFDITRRKEDDERFRVLFEEIGRARSQLMDAIESLDAGFAMYDAEDRLVICNRKYKELYGVGAEVLTAGRSYESILNLLVQRGAHKASGLSKEAWLAQEKSARREDAEPTEHRLGKRWIRSNDRRTADGFWVCLRTDVTRIRQAQEDLRVAKDAAEEATRAKSEFLARMSHEIRTPMNGVTGMVELALRTSVTPEQRDYLETARGSAKSLLSLINDILDFSKVEAGQLRLDLQPFRLRDGLGEMLKSLSLRAGEQGLELMFSASPEVPDRLLGDVQRVRQVVTNLVANAIKFTPRGEILVSCAVERRTESDVLLHFTVADSGIGIAKDKLEHIFEAFAQGDEATTRRYGGTGLGLAICRQLCGLMGGRIWVESEVNEGSRFHFTARFPLDLSASATPAAAFEAGTVLIVDDSAQHRLILQEQFSHWRMTARTLPDATSALEALQQAARSEEPISLLVVNADLPNKSAAWLLSAMQADSVVWQTPVIWLAATGTALPVCHPTRFRRVSKPVIPSPLFEAAQSLLTGSFVEHEIEETPRPQPKVSTKLRILVADDNAINRQVAARLLEMDGHEVLAVVDGRAAVEAVQREHFDAVLMDVQMPEMDGFTATRTIRALEEGKGEHLPIIAVTAQAMKGDDQRCRDAGMDDYVAKPIDPAALTAALGRALPRVSAAPRRAAERTRPASQGEDVAIDVPRLFELAGQSRELVAEAAQIFKSDLPLMLKSVQASLNERNAQGLARAAHKLKGALLSLSAGPAATAAKQLEQLAEEQTLSDAGGALAALERELSRVEHALDNVLSAKG